MRSHLLRQVPEEPRAEHGTGACESPGLSMAGTGLSLDWLVGAEAGGCQPREMAGGISCHGCQWRRKILPGGTQIGLGWAGPTS